MDPNAQQPQDPNNVPVPVPVPPQPGQQPVQYQPPQYVQPGQTQQAQPQPAQPPAQPGWFANTPVAEPKPERRFPLHLPSGKALRTAVLLVVILGLLGGIGFGLNSLLGVSDQENEKLSAQLAFKEEVEKTLYMGDGTDIERSVAPDITYECPTGYTKTTDGTGCISPTTKVSPANYNCDPGFTKSGSGSKTKCFKIEGGTNETVVATKKAECTNGFTKAGEKCTKTEVVNPLTSYTCPASYVPTAENASGICVKSVVVATALTVTCNPADYVYSGGTCSKSVPANEFSKPPSSCPTSGYTMSYSHGTNMLTKWLCTGRASGILEIPRCSSGTLVEKSRGSYTCRFTKARVVTRTYYSCSGIGGSLSGTKCLGTTARSTERGCTGTLYNGGCYTFVKNANPVYEYGCSPSSYIWSGSVCVYDTTSVFYYADGRSCAAGSRNGWVCSYEIGYGKGYSCNGKEVSVSTCTLPGTASYSCKPGFIKVGSGAGTGCAGQTSDTKPIIVTTYCTGEFTLVSGKCQRVVSAEPVITYSCGTGGYTLSGTSCSRIVGGKEVTTPVIVNYSCPEGFTAAGEGKDMTCTKPGDQKVDFTKNYKCEEGWKQRTDVDPVVCVLVKQS